MTLARSLTLSLVCHLQNEHNGTNRNARCLHFLQPLSLLLPGSLPEAEPQVLQEVVHDWVSSDGLSLLAWPQLAA